MTASVTDNTVNATPEFSGVAFSRSSENFPVASVDDIVLAMLPGRGGVGLLASAWPVSRPLGELKRSDFYVYESTLINEGAFRNRAFETAGHKRDLRGLARQTMRVQCSTPWGLSQGATIYAEGIACHSTASHDGFKLSADRKRKVHPMLRAEGGWYEQDAAWAIVAITYPQPFIGYERRCAAWIIKDSWPDAWETIFGTILQSGESHEKDRRAFEQQHADDWIVISAIRSNHHEGCTEVIATRAAVVRRTAKSAASWSHPTITRSVASAS
ncbi:DUF7007 domain-containing protein [Rhizobium leguminosarum]|uniref:DUF7007 domain-containing protein n=1 Tax=Rhizobium leguminosarum TaxID=384 RepID=UPI0028F4508C|nr:hypothetical protein [Rhizobium leguminosarum]